MYSGKVDVFWSKMVVFGQSGSICVKVVVLVKNGCIRSTWLDLGKSGSIWEKMEIFRLKWMYSVKVVDLGKSG